MNSKILKIGNNWYLQLTNGATINLHATSDPDAEIRAAKISPLPANALANSRVGASDKDGWDLS